MKNTLTNTFVAPFALGAIFAVIVFVFAFVLTAPARQGGGKGPGPAVCTSNAERGQ